MGRDATKAAGNPWYQARKKAAEYDDRLCSRESAAEQLGMSVSSLADAELGNTKFMPVDKAVLMADRYNAPWLLNHYCLNECPIGCRHSLSDEVVGIDRVTVKLLKSLKTEKLGDVKDTLLDIAADGKITEDEKPALQEVLTYLDDLAKTVSELKTIGEMALNEDGDAHGSKYPYGPSSACSTTSTPESRFSPRTIGTTTTFTRTCTMPPTRSFLSMSERDWKACTRTSRTPFRIRSLMQCGMCKD